VAEYKHGDAVVRIAQAKRLTNVGVPVPGCRAWLQVVKEGRIVWHANFEDIDAVGASYGLFVPLQQPSAAVFAVVKEGDYDGRLYLIRRDGSVLDTMGGFYFVTPDHRFLISEYASDGSGIAVVDLREGKVVLSTEELPDIYAWYRSGGTYFFTEADDQATEKVDTAAYVIDIKHRRIRARPLDQELKKTAKKAVPTFDPRDYVDCVTPLERE
jgi:hypothetical protein